MNSIQDPDAEIRVSPEAMQVATTYLECSSINDTAEILGIDREQVTYYLNKKEVKRFVDTVFLDQGYLSRHKLQDAMSRIIELKLEELEEADIGSNKDIADLLMMAQKMRMDELKASTPVEEKTSVVVNNSNTGAGAFGDNYQSLMGKLMQGT